LSVIEVKSSLTLDELQKCYQAADRVRSLLPFKKRFVGPRSDGAWADDGNHRVLYTVFAYKTTIATKDWLNSEWTRIKTAASKTRVDVGVIDRILVLGRGLIQPPSANGKEEREESVLQSWFLHLINFLVRENGRRPPVDWNVYSAGEAKGWTNLDT
jgi:hypothetical protein